MPSGSTVKPGGSSVPAWTASNTACASGCATPPADTMKLPTAGSVRQAMIGGSGSDESVDQRGRRRVGRFVEPQAVRRQDGRRLREVRRQPADRHQWVTHAVDDGDPRFGDPCGTCHQRDRGDARVERDQRRRRHPAGLGDRPGRRCGDVGGWCRLLGRGATRSTWTATSPRCRRRRSGPRHDRRRAQPLRSRR